MRSTSSTSAKGARLSRGSMGMLPLKIWKFAASDITITAFNSINIEKIYHHSDRFLHENALLTKKIEFTYNCTKNQSTFVNQKGKFLLKLLLIAQSAPELCNS